MLLETQVQREFDSKHPHMVACSHSIWAELYRAGAGLRNTEMLCLEPAQREARDSSAFVKAPSDEIYDRSTQGTLCGLQFCRYLHSFICCCLPNIRTFELIAVQGHPRTKVIDLGVNRKRISNFLLVSSSNYGRICNYWVQVSTWWIVFGDVQYCT